MLRRTSIEMRQLTPVTARVGIDDLPIQPVKRLVTL
jgi:hypothetical protein